MSCMSRAIAAGGAARDGVAVQAFLQRLVDADWLFASHGRPHVGTHMGGQQSRCSRQHWDEPATVYMQQ